MLLKTPAMRKSDSIIKLARKHLGRAVVIDFKDPESDWRHFRVERVKRGWIALTGMIDDRRAKHIGDFFWVASDEIKRLELRD